MKLMRDALFHRVGCGVVVLDDRGGISHLNERAEELLGGRSGWRLLGPGGEPLSAENHPFARLMAGETITGGEFRAVRPDGAVIALALNGSPLRSGDGRVRGAVIDFTDVTARQRELEEALQARRIAQESEIRLRALIGSIDEIVFEFDGEGVYRNIWTANDSLLVRPREELIGRRVEEALGEELGRPLMAALRFVLESGTPTSLEYPLEVLGGRRWFLARIAPIPSADGSPPTLSFLARDITERKRMEEELYTSQRRFRQVLENIQLATLILDPTGEIVYCNDFFLRLTGWEWAEIKGREWFEIFLPESERQAAKRRWLEAVCTGRALGYHEEHLLTRDGRRRLMGWNTIVVRDAEGKAVGCASIAEDITERRRAEEILRRSDRMKSEFISTAAHELRTPLTSIMGYAELLLQAEQFGGFTPEQRLEFAREIHEKGETLNEIVNELLDLSRFEAGESIALDLIPCRLDEVLEAQVERYRSLFPRHLFELSLDESCPADVLIDRRRMEEVLDNLLSNAAKYSSPGRCVRITGRRHDGGYLVAISDEGIGMTPEQVEHIFDKFYRADTSDTALGGLGIGMSLVRNIVEAHGGRIWVESEPLRGTTVYFFIPARGEGR